MADWSFAMQKICNWQKKISALVSLRGPRRLTRVDIFFCIKPPYNRFILIVKRNNTQRPRKNLAKLCYAYFVIKDMYNQYNTKCTIVECTLK